MLAPRKTAGLPSSVLEKQFVLAIDATKSGRISTRFRRADQLAFRIVLLAFSSHSSSNYSEWQTSSQWGAVQQIGFVSTTPPTRAERESPGLMSRRPRAR